MNSPRSFETSMVLAKRSASRFVVNPRFVVCGRSGVRYGLLSGAAGMDNGFLLHVPKPGELDALYGDAQIEQLANGG
jgi:hypothetical protein